ncbi:hypothetical protein NM688_g3555 [Phlebia brevispora]|uniref:Uncharacterized protein n=1 Tax=Phlebia brevispora TaxID=194682 RepID=A0ACC1T5L4_9APHY|nr:hypothetical protein NM688_g3555 [Phlebia brevispora]
MLWNNLRRTGVVVKDIPEGQGPQADPWVTIDKTLGGRDEEKVHDCKEDMDTLLVFAGLYSAVLTSFLVQSYQNLLEDPQQAIVTLLRQISLQTGSYTLENGYLNSTISPVPPLPPFQATITDVRVNVCWFASLVLSLSTASFGILVKQWLREYLTIDCTVPEERIRIRHFRSRGLEEWKLFEIAAALPLILQLSLALFFVGLCFFTSEINQNLRSTSITLVSGWALSLGFTFVAPLVSSRCPYKTTFLKSAFNHVRPYIRSFLIIHAGSFIRRLLGIALHGFSQLSTLCKRPCLRLMRRVRSLSLRVPVQLRSLRIFYSSDGLAPDRSQDAVRKDAHGSLAQWQGSDKSDHFLTDKLSLDKASVIQELISRYMLEEDIDIDEEDLARVSDGIDLLIFRDVDSVLRDHNLLVSMRGVLQKRLGSSLEALRLVVSVLNDRLGLRERVNTVGGGVIRKLEGLAPWTLLTFMEILSDILPRITAESGYHTMHIVNLILVLTRSGDTIPESTSAILQQMLSDTRNPFCTHLCQEIAWVHTAESWRCHVFLAMGNIFRKLDPSMLRRVVHRIYVASEDPTFKSNTYGRLLDQADRVRHRDIKPERSISPRVLEVLLDLAITIVQDTVQDDLNDARELDKSRARHVKELVQFILDAIPIMEDMGALGNWQFRSSEQINKLTRSFFTTPALLSILLDCLEAHRGFFSRKAFMQMLAKPAQHAPSSLSDDGMTNILSIYLSSLRNAARKMPLLSPPSNSPTDADTSKLFVEYRALPPLVYNILLHIDERTEDNKPLGGLISSLDWSDRRNPHTREEDAQYYSWKKMFDVDSSMYPDELIVILRDITYDPTDHYGRTFWRIRRLEDMEREKHSRVQLEVFRGDADLDPASGSGWQTEEEDDDPQDTEDIMSQLDTNPERTTRELDRASEGGWQTEEDEGVEGQDVSAAVSHSRPGRTMQEKKRDGKRTKSPGSRSRTRRIRTPH